MTQQLQPKGTVLVVDDDDAVRSGLYWALTSDYQVLQAASREQACALINDEEIDVVVSDLHLPPNVDDIAEGLALIDVARAQDPPLQVVVITGSDSKRAALEAVKHGAYGFFEKPLDPADSQGKTPGLASGQVQNRASCRAVASGGWRVRG